MLNYFICATPRTGSTWLCSLLKSTGVAGAPESYFRAQDLGMWAAEWGLEAPDAGGQGYAAYVRAALNASRTPNGVSACRVMWGTMDEMLAALRAVYPDKGDGDVELLERAFGPTRYVRLIRKDVVAQAVSRQRAELSNIWHVEGSSGAVPELHADQYDFDAIERFVAEAEVHNRDWDRWLQANAITTHIVTYEHLLAGPEREIAGLLGYLGLDRDAARNIASPNRRMADQVSVEWIRRYRHEAQQR